MKLCNRCIDPAGVSVEEIVVAGSTGNFDLYRTVPDKQVDLCDKCRLKLTVMVKTFLEEKETVLARVVEEKGKK